MRSASPGATQPQVAAAQVPPRGPGAGVQTLQGLSMRTNSGSPSPAAPQRVLRAMSPASSVHRILRGMSPSTSAHAALMRQPSPWRELPRPQDPSKAGGPMVLASASAQAIRTPRSMLPNAGLPGVAGRQAGDSASAAQGVNAWAFRPAAAGVGDVRTPRVAAPAPSSPAMPSRGLEAVTSLNQRAASPGPAGHWQVRSPQAARVGGGTHSPYTPRVAATQTSSPSLGVREVRQQIQYATRAGSPEGPPGATSGSYHRGMSPTRTLSPGISLAGGAIRGPSAAPGVQRTASPGAHAHQMAPRAPQAGGIRFAWPLEPASPPMPSRSFSPAPVGIAARGAVPMGGGNIPFWTAPA